MKQKLSVMLLIGGCFFTIISMKSGGFRAVFVIYSRIICELFVICSRFVRSPKFTNQTNKTRISRSLFAFFKNHECSFVFYFACSLDTLIRCIRDVRHFKAVVLPFLKCTITFLQPKYFRSYRHLNDEQCKYASPMNEFSENNTLYSSCLICMLYYFFRNFLC